MAVVGFLVVDRIFAGGSSGSRGVGGDGSSGSVEEW